MAYENILPSGVNLTAAGNDWSYYDDPTRGRVYFATDPNKWISATDPTWTMGEQKATDLSMAPWNPSYANSGALGLISGIDPSQQTLYHLVDFSARNPQYKDQAHPDWAYADMSSGAWSKANPGAAEKAFRSYNDSLANKGGGATWMGPAAAVVGNMLLPGIGGAIAGGLLGGGVSGMAGNPSSLVSDVLQSGAKGAAIGGGLAYAGGQLVSGLDSSVGYNPSIADATWSRTATPISQLGVQTGANAISGAGRGALNAAASGGNLFEGALKGGVSGGINTGVTGGLTSALGTGTGGAWDKLLNTGGKALGSTLTGNLFGNKPATFNNQSSGGNMALSDLSIGQIGSAVSPFLSAWNTNKQRGDTQGVYDKAMNLITTPSADQSMYRSQLKDLMTNPGTFYDSPVYKNLFDQGQQALERSQSARGLLSSGQAGTELMKYGMGQGANYYFPQLSALTQLSGVPGDTAQRTIGAQSLIQGNTQQNEMSNAMLKDLMGGVGVQTPQQQIIDAMLGKSGGSSGLGGLTIGAVKDWFNGSTPDTSSNDYNSPVFTGNMDWNNVFTNYDPSISYATPNIDLGANLGGTQSDYLQSLLNPSYDYNQSWF